jgi:hypothetical protein
MAFCQAMYKARELTDVAQIKPHPLHSALYRRTPAPGIEPHLARMAARRAAGNAQRSARTTR